MSIHKDQLSETISRLVVSVSKWPLSYPTARRPRRGAGNYHLGKPTMQWVRK
jgi:hypothetical protein